MYIEVLGVAVGMPVKVAVVVRHARVTLRLAVKRTVAGASSRPAAGHVIQHHVHVDTAPYRFQRLCNEGRFRGGAWVVGVA